MRAWRVTGYTPAIVLWAMTALHGLLASRQFIVEQFLRPELFAPLAIFANYWLLWSSAALALWAAPRWAMIARIDLRTGLALGSWIVSLGAAALATFAAEGLLTRPLIWSIAAIFMIWAVAAAEYPLVRRTADRAASPSSSDFLACVVAAFAMMAIEIAQSLARGATGGELARDAVASLRLQPLVAMSAFLFMTLIRGVAALTAAPAATEVRLSIVAIGLLIGVYLDRVAMASISATSIPERLGAYVAGCGLAYAISALSVVRFDDAADGLRTVIGAFAPRAAARARVFLIWLIALAGVAVIVDRVTQVTDWNFVVARGGSLAIGLCVLGASVRVVRASREHNPAIYFGIAGVLLLAHVALDRYVPAASLDPRPPAARWIANVLRHDTVAASGFFDLLTANTNVTGAAGQPVDVSWAPLTGSPSPVRPHIFLFVVDSLRRDYVSPYNPAVTFTPQIDAFARDALVFDRAFTQYGATGLSVPSIWIGGALLHKQYVTPFAPMNALAKLLASEHYAQWVSMDNILDVILPRTDALEPLDAGVPVKDFRMCRTLDELRGRLSARAPDAPPVFAYSLPQDVHVSVITREGAQSVDGGNYDGFYAPVASRVKRLDSCFGAFIDDLKARRLYDDSVIIVTSDHGDSLGEGGRMGHAYTLYPEIVRVPLIVRLPASLRDRFAADVARPAYTTDITPTLYRLLGHDVRTPPGGFYGEPLIRAAGEPASPPRDRMVASSYGSVYGALLRGATQLFVANAIERRELAFDIGGGATPGLETGGDAGIRREGVEVISNAVQAIGRAYQIAPR